MNDKPETMKQVELKTIARFANTSVEFLFAEVVNKPNQDYQYVMVAQQGLQRVVLAGRYNEMRAFFEAGLKALS